MRRDKESRTIRRIRHRDKIVIGRREIDLGQCCVGCSIACAFLLIAITLSVYTFSSVLQICTSSSQCKPGPGEKATCRGICITAIIIVISIIIIIISIIIIIIVVIISITINITTAIVIINVLTLLASLLLLCFSLS